jgi:hypothetical protein
MIIFVLKKKNKEEIRGLNETNITYSCGFKCDFHRILMFKVVFASSRAFSRVGVSEEHWLKESPKLKLAVIKID